jgi:hypothetical protein
VITAMGNSGGSDGHGHVPGPSEVLWGEMKIRNCSCKAIKYYRFISKETDHKVAHRGGSKWNH